MIMIINIMPIKMKIGMIMRITMKEKYTKRDQLKETQFVCNGMGNTTQDIGLLSRRCGSDGSSSDGNIKRHGYLNGYRIGNGNKDGFGNRNGYDNQDRYGNGYGNRGKFVMVINITVD